MVIVDPELSGIRRQLNGNTNDTDRTLGSELIEQHLSAKRKIQCYPRVGVSKLTIPDNFQAPARVITSKLAEIHGDGTLDELQMGLKVSITGASLKSQANPNEEQKAGCPGKLLIAVLRPGTRNYTN